MTEAEIKLWSALKGRKLSGIKFRRQHGIGDYIVDFYCPDIRLVIEVDGETHYYQSEIYHDYKRERFMANLGIETIRFTNEQIFDNLDGVLFEIEMKIDELNNRNR